MKAQKFDTIHDILRSLSLARSFLNSRIAPNWRNGKRGVKSAVGFLVSYHRLLNFSAQTLQFNFKYVNIHSYTVIISRYGAILWKHTFRWEDGIRRKYCLADLLANSH